MVFGLENLLTYGAFSYPLAFLITDLPNRSYGKKIAKKILGLFFLCFEPSEKLKSQYKNNETLFEKCALINTSGYVSTLILYLADPVIFCLF